MAGSAGPDSVKPAPASVAPLIVTGIVPVEVRVTDCVAMVLIVTSPNATLVALMLSASVAAFSCRVKFFTAPLALADIVTACAVVTAVAVAVNLTLVAFAGTITVLGTVTAELLLDKFTVSPLAGAAAVNVTVHASVPEPVMVPLTQFSALSAACAAGAVPVPLRLTPEVLIDELLAIVSCPVAAPAVVGLNTMFSVVACPGFNVTGKVLPEIAKPAPVTTAALTVTGAVPVEVMITGCGVAAVFTNTLPNVRLVVLMLSIGTAAFSCRLKFWVAPLALADIVTACAAATEDTFAVKPTLVALAGTVTEFGTVTAELLLERLTVSPPPGAAAVSVTVHVSVPDPVMAPLVQDRAFSAAADPLPVAPVPFRAITDLEAGEEPLATVS